MRFRGIRNQFAIALGKPFTPPELEALAERWVRICPEPDQWAFLLTHARKEKVVPQVYQNALALLNCKFRRLGEYLVQELEADYERRLFERKTFYPAGIATLHEILGRHGIRHLYLKGAHLESLYPADRFRQSNDIDLIVPDVESLFKATHHLSQEGFQIGFSETPWIACTWNRDSSPSLESAHLTGHILLQHKSEAGTLKVDIHAQNMPINGLGDSLLSDLWARAQDEFPTYEDAFLILIAHAAGHGYLTQKDCNDLYLILKTHGQKLDWAYSLPALECAGLAPMTRLAFSITDRHYEKGLFPSHVWTELSSHAFFQSLVALGTWLGPMRSMEASLAAHGAITYLAYRRLGRRLAWQRAKGSLQFSLAYYLSERHYHRPLVAKWLESREGGPDFMNLRPGERANLVDVSTLPEAETPPTVGSEPPRLTLVAPGATLIEAGKAQVLSLAGMLLVPTYLGLFDDDSLEAIYRLCTSWRDRGAAAASENLASSLPEG